MAAASTIFYTFGMVRLEYEATTSRWVILHDFFLQFFLINFFRRLLSEMSSEYQTVWIQVIPDVFRT